MLSDAEAVSLPVTYKAPLTTPGEITSLVREANADPECAGLILWMHTFSPAKMWINGLSQLAKPFCHFHTQFNIELPWDEIDMDFMNLSQAAHGDRPSERGQTATARHPRIVWCPPKRLDPY